MNDETRAALVASMYLSVPPENLGAISPEIMGKLIDGAEAYVDRLLAERHEAVEPDADMVERAAKVMFREELRLSQENGAHIEGPWSMFVYRDMARAALAAAGPDLQRDIALWAQQTFDKPDQDHRLTKLGNEFEELRRLTTTDRANQAGIADECADIMHLMFQIAEAWGFDLLDETRKKFEVNKQRTWAAQPDGTYQHREEPRNDTD